MKYDREWIKFKIADWLDEHYDDACWYNLASWAMGMRGFWDTFGKYGDWRDQSCLDTNGCYAYCGKCVRTGRLRE